MQHVIVFFNELIQFLFVGFAVFVFVTLLTRFKNEKRNDSISSLTDSAAIMIALAATVYLLIWLADLYTRLQSEEEYYAMITRLTGPYWFGYWTYPFCYGIFPQLLWVRKIRKVKAMRIVTAFLLVYALYIEKIIILITSLHRDYVPSGWTMLPGYFVIYDWAASVIIFSMALALTHMVKLKLSKNMH